ncbi:MAG: hypothetical protein ABI947_12820 [Chloroflexota bacterium]
MVALRQADEPRRYYDYCAANGQLSYQVIRVPLPNGGKKFIQRCPDNRDGWIYSLGDITPLPYLLPELLQAVAAGWTVFIVEGEKCATILNAALATADAQAIATCNNGGAGKWGAAQSVYLAGAAVVMLPDNDTAGYKHVVKAGRALRAAGVASLKMIPLPGLPDKGDIADWLGQGNTIPNLLEIVATASEYTPPEVERPAVTKPAPVSHLPTKPGQYTAWAVAALERETAALAGTSEGRFAALKRVANRLGTIAAHGLLSDSECLNALYSAVAANGYAQKKGQVTAEKIARWYFEKGKSYPCDLPEPKPVSRLTGIISNPNQWNSALPASFDKTWTEFKRAKAPIILAQAVLKAADAGKLDSEAMSQKSIADATGLTLRQVQNALEIDAGVFFTDSAYGISSDQKEDISSKAESVKSPDSAKFRGRPSKLYAMRTIDSARENLIERIVIPGLKMKHFPTGDPKRYAEPDAELLRAADIDVSLLDVLRQHMIYPSGNVDALKAFNRDLNRHRFALNNLEPLQLPALPDDMPITNGKRYNAAKVAAAALPHCDGKISLQNIADRSGISKRTVDALLPFAGIGMRENFVEYPVTHELPEPTYNYDLQAWPAKLSYVNVDGEFKTLPYCEYNGTDGAGRPTYKITPEAASAAQAALSANRPVTVLCRQAGTPYQMTAEERADALAAQVKPATSKPKTSVLKTAIAMPRFDGVGYAPLFAERWRNALVDHLPADVMHLLNSRSEGKPTMYQENDRDDNPESLPVTVNGSPIADTAWPTPPEPLTPAEVAELACWRAETTPCPEYVGGRA